MTDDTKEGTSLAATQIFIVTCSEVAVLRLRNSTEVFKLDINRSAVTRELVDQLLEGPVSQGGDGMGRSRRSEWSWIERDTAECEETNSRVC